MSISISIFGKKTRFISFILIILSVICLIFLGNWQLSRLKQKTNFIQKIETNIINPPISLDDHTYDLYTKEERAVLDLSFASGENPNSATRNHFSTLEPYFSKKAIVDIVAVISLFGFLNRWNDTLGTQIEAVPNSFMNDNSIEFI